MYCILSKSYISNIFLLICQVFALSKSHPSIVNVVESINLLTHSARCSNWRWGRAKQSGGRWESQIDVQSHTSSHIGASHVEFWHLGALAEGQHWHRYLGHARGLQECRSICWSLWHVDNGSHLHALHAYVGQLLARALPTAAATLVRLFRSSVLQLRDWTVGTAQILTFGTARCDHIPVHHTDWVLLCLLSVCRTQREGCDGSLF